MNKECSLNETITYKEVCEDLIVLTDKYYDKLSPDFQNQYNELRKNLKMTLGTDDSSDEPILCNAVNSLIEINISIESLMDEGDMDDFEGFCSVAKGIDKFNAAEIGDLCLYEDKPYLIMDKGRDGIEFLLGYSQNDDKGIWIDCEDVELSHR